MPDNNEIFSLTHEEHRRIFEELKAQHIEGRRASRKPQAIILLGQPGSVSNGLMTSITQNLPDKKGLSSKLCMRFSYATFGKRSAYLT